MNISRRTLLVGAAGAVVPRSSAADSAFAFGFFSDTDIGQPGKLEACAKQFSAMANQRFAFAIHGGNVTAAGRGEEFNAYRDLVLAQSFPIYHVPGNQDEQGSGTGLKAFQQTLKTKPYGSFDRAGCHFILLDSTLGLTDLGHVDREQLKWLQADLRKTGNRTPLFVAVHHPLGFDAIEVDNEEALLRLLAGYNVKLILCGHGRKDAFWTCDGLGITMNRSLAEGSWQSVVVDPQSQVVGLFRHREASLEPDLIITIPLAPSPKQRPQWAHLDADPKDDSGTELRWDNGAWQPMKNGLVPSSLPPGLHRLTFRRDQRNYFLGPTVPVRSRSGFRAKWTAILPGGCRAQPTLERDVLLVPHSSGLIALTADRGAEKWRVATGSVVGAAVPIRDIVLFGSLDGKLNAANFSDGILKWSAPLPGPIWGSPIVIGDLAIAASGEGTVQAHKLRTGEQVWRTHLPAFVASRLVADATRVYVAATDGTVYSLSSATGEIAWQASLSQLLQRESQIVADPSLTGGRLYVTTLFGDLVCLATDQGKLLWTARSTGDPFGESAPTVLGDRVWLASQGGQGEFRCLSGEDGTEIWRTSLGSPIRYGGCAVDSGKVAAATLAGELVGMEAATGKQLIAFQLPTGHMIAKPLLVNHALYAVGLNEVAVAFDLTNFVR